MTLFIESTSNVNHTHPTWSLFCTTFKHFHDFKLWAENSSNVSPSLLHSNISFAKHISIAAVKHI